jgi:putative membrane protein
MKSLQRLPIALVLGLTICACNSNRAATPDAKPTTNASAATASADQQFLDNAAKGNRAEVELGQMMEKSKNPGVKSFAQLMVKDHTDALNQLQQLAQSKNVTLADGLPADAADLKQKLSSEQGTQRDRDYVKGMVDDHQNDVKDFQDASQKAKDSDVKQWAAKTLPTLQEHLQKIQKLDSTMNKNQ